MKNIVTSAKQNVIELYVTTTDEILEYKKNMKEHL